MHFTLNVNQHIKPKNEQKLTFIVYLNMKYLITIIITLICSVGLQAQETVPATGGDATGAGGSSSYTVGQVVYTTNTGTNGSVAQGVQQHYEISIVIGIEQLDAIVEMSVFPNPTTYNLNLKIVSEKLENLSYQIYNLQTKLIESKKVTSNNTSIDMGYLPKATYFLTLMSNNQTVKTFRIIKN